MFSFSLYFKKYYLFVFKNKKGYFEDRRPSSNCDPYLVTSKIMETISSK